MPETIATCKNCEEQFCTVCADNEDYCLECADVCETKGNYYDGYCIGNSLPTETLKLSGDARISEAHRHIKPFNR